MITTITRGVSAVLHAPLTVLRHLAVFEGEALEVTVLGADRDFLFEVREVTIEAGMERDRVRAVHKAPGPVTLMGHYEAMLLRERHVIVISRIQAPWYLRLFYPRPFLSVRELIKERRA